MNPDDLRKEVYRNESELSVKFTHLPTGLVSMCSVRRYAGGMGAAAAMARVEATALRWLEEKVRSHETE